MKTNYKIFVVFSEIFEEEPKNLLSYLTGIPRSLLLKLMTNLSTFPDTESEFGDYEPFLVEFFSNENEVFAREINAKLINLRRNLSPQVKYSIINPLTTLQIFQFCFDHLTEESTQSNAEIERNVFKSLLLINEQNRNLQDKAKDSTNGVLLELRPAALLLAHSFAYFDIVNYRIEEVLITQLFKSLYLFEFLESCIKTAALLAEFLTVFNCSDWKDFIKKCLPILTQALLERKEGNRNIRVEQNEHFHNHCNFIENLTIIDAEGTSNNDFIRFRNRPLYKISDGTYRIIYGLFVVELIYKGLFFKLKEIDGRLKNIQKSREDFRGFYNNEFSEKFLLYKTLNSIYQNRYIEFNEVEMKNNTITSGDKDGLPDYYIRKDDTLFLFESKDILVNATIKPTYDFKQYEKEFREKLYCYVSKSGKTEKKAILQLINNVRKTLKKELSFDQGYNKDSISIYPIIVLHDRQFSDVLGLNIFINHWFTDELIKLQREGINIDNVRPIAIINIDTFILYQDILKDGNIELEIILDSYFYSQMYNDERKFEPFSDFLISYLGKQLNNNERSKVPTKLWEKALQFLH